MAAVPAAKPRAGAVAGGRLEILVVLAQVVHSPAPVVAPALPHGMTGARPAVSRHLDEAGPHLVHPGLLKLCAGLVHAREHGPAAGYLQRVSVAAGVGDVGHGVGKAVHSTLDGGLVVERAAAHLEPCPVQRLLKSSGDGVGRGGGEIGEAACRLPIARVEQALERCRFFEGRWLFPVMVIDLILGFQCGGRGLLHQAADLGLALAGIPGQKLHHILADGLGLLVAPELPVRRRRQGVHLADAPGHVPQDVVLGLLPEQDEPVGCVVEVVRGQHQAPPPKVSSGWRFSVRASSASRRASSSEMPYRAERYL